MDLLQPMWLMSYHPVEPTTLSRM